MQSTSFLYIAMGNNKEILPPNSPSLSLLIADEFYVDQIPILEDLSQCLNQLEWILSHSNFP